MSWERNSPKTKYPPKDQGSKCPWVSNERTVMGGKKCLGPKRPVTYENIIDLLSTSTLNFALLETRFNDGENN